MELADRRIGQVDEATLLGRVSLQVTKTCENSHRVVPERTAAALTETGSVRVRVPAPGTAVVRVVLAG